MVIISYLKIERLICNKTVIVPFFYTDLKLGLSHYRKNKDRWWGKHLAIKQTQ